jgi:hypothetical protein
LCFVADELTRFAAHLALVRGDANYASTAQTAGAAWTATRRAIRPYNDGTRRPQEPSSAPAVIVEALRIHRVISAAARRPFDEHLLSRIHDALQHLPELSVHVRRALRDATASNRMIAYACDLPYVEEREAQFVAGRTTQGIVTARGGDVRPILAALHEVYDLATAIAAVPTPARGYAPEARRQRRPAVRCDDPVILCQKMATAERVNAVRRVTSLGAGPHGRRR